MTFLCRRAVKPYFLFPLPSDALVSSVSSLAEDAACNSELAVSLGPIQAIVMGSGLVHDTGLVAAPDPVCVVVFVRNTGLVSVPDFVVLEGGHHDWKPKIILPFWFWF
jgi:hypothetical protein